VYFAETNDVTAAIAREKEVKGWLQKKKIALIEEMNPGWQDFSAEWYSDGASCWYARDEILRCAQNDKDVGSCGEGLGL
jgi:hypothetical protein